MTWAAQRRFVIIIILFAVIGSIAFYVSRPIIFRPPSCTDGKKDGTETGVDCGGICTNLCSADIKIPTILWARSFPVTNNVYNAVAYVENNNDAATQSIAYEFRLYDAQGIFITRVDGTTIIPPLGRYAIVETGIQTEQATVARTTFEFSTTPAVWEHVPSNIERLQIATSSTALDTSGTIPKLSATLTNPSPTIQLNNTVVAAILYDANDNAVNVSRTIVPVLAPGASVPVYFTWPMTLSAPVVRYELLPIIDIFHTTGS